jgi:hypothetical protein
LSCKALPGRTIYSETSFTSEAYTLIGRGLQIKAIAVVAVWAFCADVFILRERTFSQPSKARSARVIVAVLALQLPSLVLVRVHYAFAATNDTAFKCTRAGFGKSRDTLVAKMPCLLQMVFFSSWTHHAVICTKPVSRIFGVVSPMSFPTIFATGFPAPFLIFTFGTLEALVTGLLICILSCLTILTLHTRAGLDFTHIASYASILFLKTHIRRKCAFGAKIAIYTNVFLFHPKGSGGAIVAGDAKTKSFRVFSHGAILAPRLPSLVAVITLDAELAQAPAYTKFTRCARGALGHTVSGCSPCRANFARGGPLLIHVGTSSTL